ncbi:hypothetical protein IAT38_001508 [Cryptococcus sp. DSM 104549]
MKNGHAEGYSITSPGWTPSSFWPKPGPFAPAILARSTFPAQRRLAREETEFYIKHGSDWLKQYLSDEKGCITGVVDWERAYVTTKAEAFGALGDLASGSGWGVYPGSTGSSLTSGELLLIAAYERLGRPDLADCVREARLYQYLAQTLRSSMWGTPITVISDIRQAILGEKAGKPWKTKKDWEKATVQSYRGDLRLVDMAWPFYLQRGKRVMTETMSVLLEEKLGVKVEPYDDCGKSSKEGGRGDSATNKSEYVPPAYEYLII